MPSGDLGYVHTDVAPSYGKITSPNGKLVDDKLKAIIAGTLKDLVQKPVLDRGWGAVMSAMMQNDQLEPGPESEVRHVGVFTNTGLFKQGMTATQRKQAVTEASAFLHMQVSDKDVLQCSKIDPNTFANVVAADEDNQVSGVDVGVLRDPGLHRPHLKVHRLAAVARAEHKGGPFTKWYENPMVVEYDARIFQLRKEVYAKLFDELLVTSLPNEVGDALFGL